MNTNCYSNDVLQLFSVKCYQCAYSPGKTVYEEETYPEEIVTYDEYHNKVTKTIYKVKY